nr:MAG TPA: hypothetical protein [Caudoviricetes sp.]
MHGPSPPSALFLLYIDFYTCFDVQSPYGGVL